MRTSNVEAAEKKGLLWILDEEAIFPGATEDSFMDRFFTYHGEQKVRRKFSFVHISSLVVTIVACWLPLQTVWTQIRAAKMLGLIWIQIALH